MNEQKLINLIGEIGRLLLKHGAEIYRVEESLLRMCKSYGYLNVEVFALPSYFTLTIEMHDNHTYTLSKRTQQNRVNLDMVYELNNLVRYTCQECPDYIHLKSKLEKIKNTPINMPLVFLGYGLGTGFFTTFFGGGIHETIIAVGIGFTTASESGIWDIFPSIIQSVFAENVVAVVFIISIVLSCILPENMDIEKIKE